MAGNRVWRCGTTLFRRACAKWCRAAPSPASLRASLPRPLPTMCTGWPMRRRAGAEHTTKTQYLFRINKGTLDVGQPRHQRLPAAGPTARAIFADDFSGGSAKPMCPCMRLVKDQGGHSLAFIARRARRKSGGGAVAARGSGERHGRCRLFGPIANRPAGQGRARPAWPPTCAWSNWVTQPRATR